METLLIQKRDTDVGLFTVLNSKCNTLKKIGINGYIVYIKQ